MTNMQWHCYKRLGQAFRFTKGTALIVLHSLIRSPVNWLGPTSAGHETSAEGEVGITILVLSPGTERHHDNCAVVLWAVVKSLREKKRSESRQPSRVSSGAISTLFRPSHLVWYPLSCFFGVVALINDVADLLAVHNEVNTIGGQCQEGVMDMVQLEETRIHAVKLSTMLPLIMQTYTYSLCLGFSDDPHFLQVKVSDTACHG